MILHANEKLRSLGRMNVYPVKLRNAAVPIEPLKIPAEFAYSKVGGNIFMRVTAIDDAYADDEEDNYDNCIDECNDYVEDDEE
jgi:hypothetical protein